jgi:glycogen debranching enzyme
MFGSDASDDAARWSALAADLQAATMTGFWMPRDDYFAMGIDRDPATGERRQIATLSAMATELLDTGIFDTLAEDDRQRYLGGIVRMAHGPEFLTPAGIRSRGIRHLDLLPYPDYHGVLTCWGVTNGMYATGLARQGLPALASDIVCRHIGMLAQAGALYEFLYVDPEGVVRHPLLDPTGEESPADVIAGTNRPETDQGWTLSFALRSYMEASEAEPGTPTIGSWQEALTAEVAGREPLLAEFTSRPELMRAAFLDRATAVRHESAYLAAEP